MTAFCKFHESFQQITKTKSALEDPLNLRLESEVRVSLGGFCLSSCLTLPAACCHIKRKILYILTVHSLSSECLCLAGFLFKYQLCVVFHHSTPLVHFVLFI